MTKWVKTMLRLQIFRNMREKMAGGIVGFKVNKAIGIWKVIDQCAGIIIDLLTFISFPIFNFFVFATYFV